MLRWGVKNKSPGHTPVCDRSRSEVRNSSHAFYRRPLTMYASQARGRTLAHKHCKLPAGRPVFSQSALRTDSIFGQVRDTTVQVWTVGKGLGIRSEFSQTGCAACQLRKYSVVGQFEISAYNPRDHQADQTYHKYDNA